MATPFTTVDLVEDTLHTTPDRQFVTQPIGWSSILAATAITLGVWLVLHLFGIGVGLTAVEPDDASSLRGVGIGVGVWSIVAPILALFVGGLVAGRVAPTINTLNAVIHGGVVWALSLLVTMLMVWMMFGSLVRGVSSAGSAMVGTATSAVGLAGDSGGALEALGIDADDLFAPINRQLQERGMPPVAPEQARDAAREALQQAVRSGGDLDRARLVEIVARRTALSRQDAEQVATELERRFQAARQRGGEIAKDAQRGALEVAEGAGKVVLALFGLMVLGLGAAVGGSILAVRRERRTHVVLPRAATR